MPNTHTLNIHKHGLREGKETPCSSIHINQILMTRITLG